MPDSVPAIFILFVIVAFIFRLLAGSFDGERVEAYIRDMGCELLDKSWDPFGPGWFGEKDSRIYQIIYRDQGGNIHQPHVKTSMMTGVYLTNDRIIKSARAEEGDEPATTLASLQEENRRLRRRIDEMERGSR